MSLKDLTWEVHQRAERTEFARKLLKGLTAEEYYRYIYNQYLIYSILETQVYNKIPEIRDIFNDISRSSLIHEDLKELEVNYKVPHATPETMMPVVVEYEKHLVNLDKAGLLAHLYVRHFGDMYGGQMIKKRNPGSGKMYNFNNVEDLKTKIRSMLNDNMAEEANRCFEFAIKLFTELESK
jgi:heme oxygenase (biliverdin-producing, ferredoxin)